MITGTLGIFKCVNIELVGVTMRSALVKLLGKVKRFIRATIIITL